MKKYNQLSQRERDLIDMLSRKGESCATKCDSGRFSVTRTREGLLKEKVQLKKK